MGANDDLEGKKKTFDWFLHPYNFRTEYPKTADSAHERFWTARQSSQVVNWVKTKLKLAGNQISFRGTRFGFA